MKLSDNEKRDVIKYLESGKPLPEKYRFLLFDDDREVELVWNGKTEETSNIILPFQTIEHIDEPRSEEEIKMQQNLFDISGHQIQDWTNKLIWGDNKLILSSLKSGPLRKQIDAQGGIKLIYIDPPFDVGADFSMQVQIGDEEFIKKPSIIEEVAYRDTWGKGADSFISMIYERLSIMKDLLADNGSIYVHCDWRVSGYMRLILDEIFGEKNFLNEIIWAYGERETSKRFYNRKHDVIFYYSKNIESDYIFNPDNIRETYSEVTIKKFRYTDEDGRKYRLRFKDGRSDPTEESEDTYRQYLDKNSGALPRDWFILPFVNQAAQERIEYPTQKPEALLERIIKASSNENDIVADFFVGSGTTLAVAEKLGRKWIGSDLGRFSIHTTRKRMIGVQRELKKSGKNFRAFEILNIGKYEREQFIATNDNLRKEEKQSQQRRKEQEFIKLILSAYKAEPIDSFLTMVGKKRDRLVAIGPINFPVSADFLHQVVAECVEKNITKVDVLGFDWEMGLEKDQFKNQGVDLQLRVIPREVFDKQAVEKGQVKFYEVAFIEVKPIVKKNTITIELTDFSVFYNQDDTGEIEEKLKQGGAKVVIENGQVIKLSKDKNSEVIKREVLTTKWTDWVDYWAVDFNFENKKEFIRKVNPKTKEEEVWTGGYIFENEWQSFRTKSNRNLDLNSVPKEVHKGRLKVAVKVVDIFGNDTTKVIEVAI